MLANRQNFGRKFSLYILFDSHVTNLIITYLDYYFDQTTSTHFLDLSLVIYIAFLSLTSALQQCLSKCVATYIMLNNVSNTG